MWKEIQLDQQPASPVGWWWWWWWGALERCLFRWFGLLPFLLSPSFICMKPDLKWQSAAVSLGLTCSLLITALFNTGQHGDLHHPQVCLLSALILLVEMIDVQSSRSRSSLDRLNHTKCVFSPFAFGCWLNSFSVTSTCWQVVVCVPAASCSLYLLILISLWQPGCDSDSIGGISDQTLHTHTHPTPQLGTVLNVYFYPFLSFCGDFTFSFREEFDVCFLLLLPDAFSSL